eukprot:13231047-Alexandrium_andersonii.AAC.1
MRAQETSQWLRGAPFNPDIRPRAPQTYLESAPCVCPREGEAWAGYSPQAPSHTAAPRQGVGYSGGWA